MKHAIAAIFLVTGLNCLGQTETTTAARGPQITFQSEVHDYGTIPYAGNGECEFTYSNTGDEPLIISQCRSSCGCLVPSCMREPLAPGQSAVVRVKYDTKRPGPINKSVTVTSNATNSPVVVLRIKGTVQLEASAQPTPAITKP